MFRINVIIPIENLSEHTRRKRTKAASGAGHLELLVIIQDDRRRDVYAPWPAGR
jgi:hypothetical protein